MMYHCNQQSRALPVLSTGGAFLKGEFKMNIETSKRLKRYFQMCSKQMGVTFEKLKEEIQKYENEEFIMTISFGGGRNGR